MHKIIEDSVITTYELGPLYFPEMFPPHMNNPGVDGNLGLHHSEHPQVLYINHPKGAYPGQLLELFSNDSRQPISYTFIGEDDPPLALVPLLLPVASIRPLWISPLECRINQTGAASVPLRLRVDLNAPAGTDPAPDVPGHQGLILSLPEDIVFDGLSELRAREHVQVNVLPYLHMAKNDRLLLCWGDQHVYHWVKEWEVGHSINIEVPYALIMRAHDSSLFNVTLQVRGHTGNLMDLSARWSATTKLNVHVHNAPLEHPVLEGADPNTQVIDLEQLNGGPVICHVFATRDYFEPTDVLHVYCHGTDAKGKVLTHSVRWDISRANQMQRIPLPNDYLLDLAQGLLVVHCVLEKHDGSGFIASRASHATVKGAVQTWSKPQLNGPLKNGHLSPDATGLTVFVPFHKHWKPSDLISLVWLLPDTSGPVVYRHSRSAGDRPQSGLLVFELPDTELKRFEGRPSHMYYEARDFAGNNEHLGQSLRLTLTVGEPWAPMLAPVVDLAVDHELDLSQAHGGVQVTVRGAQPDSLILLYWVGPGASITLASYPSIPPEEPRRIRVPEHFVAGNLGKSVKLYWMIASAGKPQRYSQVSTVWIVDRARP